MTQNPIDSTGTVVWRRKTDPIRFVLPGSEGPHDLPQGQTPTEFVVFSKKRAEALLAIEAKATAPMTMDELDLKAALAAAQAANESDRAEVARILNAIEKTINGYSWAIESRGSHEWNDDDYRKEFSRALSELEEDIKPLFALAKNISHCPSTLDETMAAREPLDRIATVEAKCKALMAKYKDLERCYFDIGRDVGNAAVASVVDEDLKKLNDRLLSLERAKKWENVPFDLEDGDYAIRSGCAVIGNHQAYFKGEFLWGGTAESCKAAVAMHKLMRTAK